jgi:hypothetical protein
VLREAQPEPAETLAAQGLQWKGCPVVVLPVSPVLGQDARSRKEREILRIASWYNWGSEIARALDAAGAITMAGLSDDELERLYQRMRALEECVQEGLDPPDAPPAR